MTLDEAYSKFTSLDEYFVRCEAIGQGINTKESVQFAVAAEALTELGQGETRSEYHDCTAADYVRTHQTQLDAIKKARLLYQQSH